MEKITILPVLQKIPLLTDLNEHDHEEIIKAISLEYFPAEHLLLKEGEKGSAMFIIKSGQVKIYHGDGEAEKEIALLGPNDFCGEMSLISDEPRNASAKTLTECEIFRLKKEDFKKLLATNQTMASMITKEFLGRVKENESVTRNA